MAVLEVSAAALCRDQRVLVFQRAQGQSLAGFWEFPGGKCEPGETLQQCLQRELLEELCIEARVGQLLGCHSHVNAQTTVRLSVFAVTSWVPEPLLSVHDQSRWLAAQELDSVNWAPADRSHLPAVEQFLARR